MTDDHRDERRVLNLVMHMFAYIFFSFEDVELYNWFVPAHVHVSVWLLLGYPPSALADDRLRFHPLAFVHGSRLNIVRWVEVPRNRIHVYEKGKRKVRGSWFIVTSVQSSGPCP